jgi:hypothetical protein
MPNSQPFQGIPCHPPLLSVCCAACSLLPEEYEDWTVQQHAVNVFVEVQGSKTTQFLHNNVYVVSNLSLDQKGEWLPCNLVSGAPAVDGAHQAKNDCGTSSGETLTQLPVGKDELSPDGEGAGSLGHGLGTHKQTRLAVYEFRGTIAGPSKTRSSVREDTCAIHGRDGG